MKPEARTIHVVHFVYRFSIGGLENVIVQLINRLPAARYRHTVVSLTTIDEFRARIDRDDVEFIALDKPDGHAVPLYRRIHALLRRLRPDVLHSCNLAALEVTPLAWLARVPRRVHAEHGWDAHDPHGRNPRYRRLRKLYKPFVSHYVSVSQDLDNYLAQAIAVPPARRSLIANGVDTEAFAPAAGVPPTVAGCPFTPRRHWLVGTVGRLQTVKNQPALARAFVALLRAQPEAAERARLVIVGEGPLRAEVERILAEAGMAALAWLPGARSDVPALLRMLDCFVLPSLTEGTSCTLQEAMACGLPIVATAVGGTPDLVAHDVTGQLVPSEDDAAMARALGRYLNDAPLARRHGQAAQQSAQRFALSAMVARYDALFTGAPL
ncbi:TIGR03088 family PEP-CTERM/XrtA system glycosyltransferase [Pseudorhodoferax sp. Leaf267]|uniref:TIGR03088 family PEP-CTERM/XrtA system glycosyltransferase n=1 Tax=Pseudorhodoferax sp. Leaf267 TaxID=1736316 RepID=UPI0006FE75FF|nr:TIGR03088 family PEP-CTERM/XrtA system glycosyltransferase [Pseudorhodoferax sp. Leaf267]KQP23639.1 sugar transferase [Pseudorhodoferax sp. Leaf267]